MSAPVKKASAKARYDQLSSAREPYLTRARSVSALTVPYIMPPEGDNGTSDLHTQEQGVGAQCITNLADKTLMALFPTTQPFVRFRFSPEVLAEMEELSDEERGALIAAQSRREQRIVAAFEQSNIREVVLQALMHLFVTGNALVHLMPGGDYRLIGLDRFVVVRDAAGEVVEAVFLERHKAGAIPEAVLSAMTSSPLSQASGMEEATVYTHMLRQPNRSWRVYQEVDGNTVPGSEGGYSEAEFPFFFLRGVAINGEDYGRSRGELYRPDFYAADKLHASLLDGAALSTRMWLGVKPGAVVKVEELNDATNGEAVTANTDDVFPIALATNQSLSALQSVMQFLERIELRLYKAFLLNTSVARDAERVTAEEIRWLVQELEAVQAGLYSSLARDFQKRLVEAVEADLVKRKVIPKVPKDAQRPVIVTGLEALGKGYDLQKLGTFAQYVQSLPPEAQARVKWGNILTDTADNIGFPDPTRYVMTDEEFDAVQQQQMAQQALAAGATSGADVAGQGLAAAAINNAMETE